MTCDPESLLREARKQARLRDYSAVLGTVDRALPYTVDDKISRSGLYHLRGLALERLFPLEPRRALDCYREAISLHETAECWCFVGMLLYTHSQFEKATKAFRAALRLKPDMAVAQDFLSACLRETCAWAVDPVVDAGGHTLGVTKSPPFGRLAAEDCPARQLERSRLFARTEASAVRHLTERLATPAIGASDSSRFRVGYFTADWGEHATSRLMDGVFRSHDPDRFEIVVYAYGPKLNTSLAERYRGAVSAVHDCSRLPDRDFVELAKGHRLDLAVDLNGYTRFSRSRLFHARLAPVQVNYLGYPGTLGASAWDYIVGDRVLIPEGSERFHDEKILFMPNSYQPNPRERANSLPEVNRARYGLPEEGFVMASFNRAYKITPRVYQVWLDLLGAIPDAVLWLWRTSSTQEKNLMALAARHGVADRIIFSDAVSQPEHLARLSLADVSLDTENVCAHTTASDAVWSGVPHVTLAGRQFAARVAASILTAAALDDLIASDCSEYFETVRRLAQDRSWSRTVRRRVARARETPLFDECGYTRDLEAGFEAAIVRHRSGLPPEHLFIADEVGKNRVGPRPRS